METRHICPSIFIEVGKLILFIFIVLICIFIVLSCWFLVYMLSIFFYRFYLANKSYLLRIPCLTWLFHHYLDLVVHTFSNLHLNLLLMFFCGLGLFISLSVTIIDDIWLINTPCFLRQIYFT